jgi:hypothetical protein
MKKSSKKDPKKFYCEKCDYTTCKKSQWTRHEMTAKHKNAIHAISDAIQKSSDKKYCKICGKDFNHLSSLYRHQKTCKNGSVLFPNVSKCFQNVSNQIICDCGKIYKTRSGFYKHKKICKILNKKKSEKITEQENIIQNLDEKKQDCDSIIPSNNVEILLKGILEENKVLRKKIGELEMNVTHITNNTNNNHLSINMFLNEKCKNAMNLEDFVEKIKLTLEDLKYTNDNGYADGITNIFIKNLSDMDVTERPIHCSDQKRLQFYVKNDNEWSKDKNNEKIDNSIEQISQKQLKSINEWTNANPNFMENDRKRDEYIELVNKVIQPNDKKNLRTIKRKIGENVKLDNKTS